MKSKKRIAILTSGGGCPGINAVIRAVAKKAIGEKGMEVVGIEDGYDGLVANRHRKLVVRKLAEPYRCESPYLPFTKRAIPLNQDESIAGVVRNGCDAPRQEDVFRTQLF